MPIQRYKLTLGYRGTRYHGWQRQAVPTTYTRQRPPQGQGIPTVQEILERTMGGVIGHPITLTGSSRTDSGVHAKGQIAHFDTDQVQIPPEGMRRAINHRLPEDILIRSIEPVNRGYSAVRSTMSKRYQYFIWNALDRPFFFSDLAWHRWQELDVAAMRRAAAHFVGEHDFASVARPGHGRDNTVRTVHDCQVSRQGPRVLIGVSGNGFLWNMVRIMVGTLVEIGQGKRDADAIPDILAARDRRAAGSTAPAHGLYLHWIRDKRGEPS